MKSNRDIKLSEFSRRGGKKTYEKYGKEHYQKLAKKANETIKAKYGPEYYKDLAKKGLEARKKKKIDPAIQSIPLKVL